MRQKIEKAENKQFVHKKYFQPPSLKMRKKVFIPGIDDMDYSFSNHSVFLVIFSWLHNINENKEEFVPF